MKLIAGGYLTFYMPQRKNTIEIQVNTPTPLKTLLSNLNIPIAEVHLVALNGTQVNIDEALVSGPDLVHIYSSVDGG